MNLLLAIVLFSTIVGDMLPVTNSTPLIGTYFNAIMFMVASSVVTTILILNYHHRVDDTHEMPNWVQLIFLRWIPWFLRMSRPGEKITRKTIMMQKKMKEMEQKEISSKSLLANVLDIEDDFRGKNPPYMQSIHPSHVKPPILNGTLKRRSSLKYSLVEESTEISPPLKRELGLILKEIRVITDKIRDDDDSSTVEGDWRFAAMVLDRLCLLFFTVFTIITTVVVMLAAPHVIVT